jgi:hypothetical protein
MLTITRTSIIVALALAASASSALAQVFTYRVLATNKTSTMQKEMQEAGDAGFRFAAAMGGDTAVGGKEVVVLMEKAPGETARYEYRVQATNKTSTLQKELQEAGDAGFQVVGQTVFESTFGGKETAALLQRNAGTPKIEKFEYKLAATSKTSTMQKELQELADQGFQAVGMTVGSTAVGGKELVVITRRKTE